MIIGYIENLIVLAMQKEYVIFNRCEHSSKMINMIATLYQSQMEQQEENRF